MDTERGPTLAAISFALIISFANSFNLEARIPIIKEGNVGSYFGYSVAEHQAVNEIDNTVQQSWMLVGAPLDNNLQPGTNRSGALWKCPITQRRDDCEQLQIDGKMNMSSDQLSPPLDDEIKDGQWLGVTVRSKGVGGKVLVCAHRYVKKGVDYRFGFGLCYILSQLLELDGLMEPCQGRPTTRAHEQFGYCQAGTSGAVVGDDVMVIGTPGPYSWQGTVFVTSASDNYHTRDNMTYFGPLQENMSPVEKNSYLGMSVTAGDFFGNGIAYAAGAPRANETGQVVLFTKSRPSVNPLQVRLILSGDLFASSFGYELATADVNCDKIPDLIVGAPFYYGQDIGGAIYVYLNTQDHCLNCSKPLRITGKKDSSFGLSITSLGDLDMDGCEDIAVGAPYEGNGTVYVFLGSPKGLITEPSQVIHSEDLPGQSGPQTLGYSLSGGLDLDGNGYPDLLVGAYEDDKVVLIRSRPIIGINISVIPEKNLQNIDPTHPGCEKHPNSNWTCFTFDVCFTIESATRPLLTTQQVLKMKYHIEAETFLGRKFSRVWLGHNSESQPSFIERTINPSLEYCSQESVFLKENTRDIQSPIRFKLSYTLVQQEPSEYAPLSQIDRFPIINHQKAVHIFEATFQKYCGDSGICESDLYVSASLLLPSGRDERWALMLGQHKEVTLNVSVKNYGEPAYETRLFVSHPEALSYIGSKFEGKPFPCDPHNKTTVLCNIGNPFKKGTFAGVLLRFDPKGLDDSVSQLEFVVIANSTSEEIEHQEPVTLRASVVKCAELSIKGFAIPQQILYVGVVKDESAMVYHDHVGPRVIHKYKVYNKGPSNASIVEIHMEWPFQVANNKPQGKWLLYLEEKPIVESQGGGECFTSDNQVNSLKLNARPGLNETSLKSPIHMGLKYSSVVGAREGVFTDSWKYDYGEELAKKNIKREKRDSEMIVRSESSFDIYGRKTEVVTLNCPIRTANCLKFKCVVWNLQKNQEAIIRVKARLWKSTLIDDYPHVGWVKIGSRATVHIPSHLGIHQDTGDDVAQVETLAYPDLLEQQEPVPVWIFIFSVLIGILLLIILILKLWKLGFFKRNRPYNDPKVMEKH